jgi:acyl CoA:acetate/3-ketoacid CoA transferase alpha subunit
MPCPFTGETYIALSALTPDVSFVHVQTADSDGNCRIDGPRWENEEQAKAAKHLVVVAEDIVPTEEIQRAPERTIIPIKGKKRSVLGFSHLLKNERTIIPMDETPRSVAEA